MAKNDNPIDREAQKAAAAEKAAARGGSDAASTATATAKPKPKAKAKPAAARAKYPTHVQQRSALVKLVPGYKNPASPKQQDFMDDAFKKALKKLGVKLADVTMEDLLTIAGLLNQPVPEVKEGETAPTPPTFDEAIATLGQYADSNVKGMSTKPLKPLTSSVDAEAAIRPRHVAAALIAYGWQIDGSAAARLEAAKPAPKEKPDTAEGESTEQATAEDAAATEAAVEDATAETAEAAA